MGLATTRPVPVSTGLSYENFGTSLRSYQPNTPLFTIPRTALMNIKTLHELYSSPKHPLHHLRRKLKRATAIQLLTLHLAKYRGSQGAPSTCAKFGPYIDSLPDSFGFHPLQWYCKREGSETCRKLCDFLPRRVHITLETVHKRLLDDMAALEHMEVRPRRLRVALLNLTRQVRRVGVPAIR